LEKRKALLNNGHLPIPVQGKRPLLENWSNIEATDAIIDTWGETGNGTVVLCKRTAALDIDVDDAAAVDIVVDTVRAKICGPILLRTGRAPKCAIPMHAPEPFAKLFRKLRDPDGKVHKIEFLCDGQQFVVDGIHPDTGAPYIWRDGLSLAEVSLMQLPVVRQIDVERLLDSCASVLKDKLGWLDITGVAPSLPLGDNVVELHPPIAERIEQMGYQGEFPINDTLLAYTGEELRNGTSCEDLIADCRKRVLTAWEATSSDPQERPSWNWRSIDRQIDDMVYGYIKKCHEEQPRIIDCLSADKLERWRSVERAGGTPYLDKKRYWFVADSGPGKEIPEAESASKGTSRAALLATLTLKSSLPVTNSQPRVERATVKALVDTIQGNGLEVCNFDPLIGLHSIKENDNNQLAEVAEQFGDIASPCGCAIDLTHHSRKLLRTLASSVSVL
jgi:hypothetical protein